MTNGALSPPAEKPFEIKDLEKEGCILWAKVKGFSYWPGIVTVDPMDGITVKVNENAATSSGKKASRCKVHVHFLGYGNMRAWVQETDVLKYDGKEAYDKLAARCPKSKIKDFYPTKKYARLFEKAVKVADDTLKLPQEARLKKLGLVYVLVDDDEDKSAADASTTNSTNNGHSSLPKITSGFFKTYKPVLTPASSEKPSLDVFEFDDSGDQFNVDFQLRKEEEPPVVAKAKPTVPAKTPPATKPVATKATPATKPTPAKAPPAAKPTPAKAPPPTKPTKVATKRKAPKANDPGPAPKSKVRKKQVKVTSDDKGKDSIMDLDEDKIDDEFSVGVESEDKPLLGSLIWGRMSGFPYWPCFVTKGPDGDIKRVFGKRVEYHAQFFNWNNESGWVTGSMPWCPIDQYHSKAKLACPKGPNTPEGKTWYPPARLAARWKGAVLDAQKTISLSRRQRHNSLVVRYGSLPASKITKAPPPVVSKPAPTKSTAIVKKIEKKKVASLDKACPASKKKIVFKGGIVPGKIELPKGWSYELVEGPPPALKFHSPEGIMYNGVADAIAHLLQQNCCRPTSPTQEGSGHRRHRSFSCSSLHIQEEEPSQFGWFLRYTDKMHFDTRPCGADQVGLLEGSVEYLKDGSLPPAWEVRKIRSKSLDEVIYQSSSSSSSDNKLKFKDKVSVARFLEGMGHPALEVEQLLFNYPQISRIAPRDGLLNEAADASADNHISDDPKLTQCYIDMVKLPEIFHKHPHVKVRESNNEMVISDSITDAFIAKKIIYND